MTITSTFDLDSEDDGRSNLGSEVKKSDLEKAAEVLMADEPVASKDKSREESGFSVGLEGFFTGYALYSDQDAADVDNFGLKRDAEIHIQPRLVADNGLTFGVQVEVELENDEAENDIDESFLFIQGNFGQFRFGAEDGAVHLNQVVLPSADAKIYGVDPKINGFNYAGTFDAPRTYSLRPTGNADKVTYFTPRVFGFQIGTSYAGDSIQDNIGSGLLGQEVDESASVAGTIHDVVEGSIRWDGGFANLGGISLSGGYISGDQSDASADPGNYDSWNTALRYAGEFGAFRVAAGVSYAEEENRTGFGEDSDIFAAGLSLGTGPWTFGLNYFNSEADIAATTDELDIFALGLNYKLAQGVKLSTSFGMYDADDNVAAGDNDGFVVGTGIGLSF